MATKAERKQLDAAIASFHTYYASSSNWGRERWEGSLYPALSKPTCYVALVNEFVDRAELDDLLESDHIRTMPLKIPKVVEGSENDQGVTILERVDVDYDIEKPTETPTRHGVNSCGSSLVFPTPMPGASPANLTAPLQTHWNLDASSMLPVQLLDVRPGEKVLDLCAAPGGKSVALAQILFPHLHAQHPPLCLQSKSREGSLHCNELDQSRHKRLAANLRAYLPASLLQADTVRAIRQDAAKDAAVQQLPFGPNGYDKVLLDAPCSSERHVIHAQLKASRGGRLAEEMARWKPSTSKRLAKEQAALLMTALQAVRVGGRVVYSTCSIATEENDGVIDQTLATITKLQQKVNLRWGVQIENAAEDEAISASLLSKFAERTKHGWIALPDHPAGGQWGPLFFCAITKTARQLARSQN